MDDKLVKSQISPNHIHDLKETFDTLHRYQIKFNPQKCAFGVTSGMFLGFMVLHRGIETNLEKIQTM